MSSGSPNPQSVPLNYGHRGGFNEWTRNFRAAFAERFDGVFRFFGMLIGLIGGVRQLIWALGFAFAGAGLGCSLQHYSSHGPLLLFVGGFLIGTMTNVPKRS